MAKPISCESYESQLTAQINGVLDALKLRQLSWNPTLISAEICHLHVAGIQQGEHSDFWLHSGYSYCRQQVRKCINRRAGDRPVSDKHPLKRWQHLQAYYLLERDGDKVAVPVNDMTDSELEQKARLYRTMAATCYAHADELDRFRNHRRFQQEAA